MEKIMIIKPGSENTAKYAAAALCVIGWFIAHERRAFLKTFIRIAYHFSILFFGFVSTLCIIRNLVYRIKYLPTKGGESKHKGIKNHTADPAGRGINLTLTDYARG